MEANCTFPDRATDALNDGAARRLVRSAAQRLSVSASRAAVAPDRVRASGDSFNYARRNDGAVDDRYEAESDDHVQRLSAPRSRATPRAGPAPSAGEPIDRLRRGPTEVQAH